MPLIEDGLYSLLKATAVVTALVGSGDSTRVYGVEAPDKTTYPYIVFARDSGPRETTHDGNAGLAQASFELACWSDTYRGAKLLAKEIVKLFAGKSGAWGSTTDVDSVVFNEIDLRDPHVKAFKCSVYIRAWYREDT